MHVVVYNIPECLYVVCALYQATHYVQERTTITREIHIVLVYSSSYVYYTCTVFLTCKTLFLNDDFVKGKTEFSHHKCYCKRNMTQTLRKPSTLTQGRWMLLVCN
jgi:hypothetical protein